MFIKYHPQIILTFSAEFLSWHVYSLLFYIAFHIFKSLWIKPSRLNDEHIFESAEPCSYYFEYRSSVENMQVIF